MTQGRIVSFSLPIEPLGQSPRTVWVYLPASYDHADKPFSVLYMFDGHNLFDDSVATYGKSWGIRDYLDKTGLDLVVIGQDCNHSGSRRIDEYCPFPPVRVKGWEDAVCQGDITADWFVRVLKPYCEKHFRIRTDREGCAVGGSSMGGLMGDYMAALYNDVYAGFACVSPATEFAYRRCLKLVQSSKIRPDTRIYRSLGSSEYRVRRKEMQMLDRLMTISNAFSDHGCLVHNRIAVGAQHNEAAWEELVPEFIDFLFPSLKHTG